MNVQSIDKYEINWVLRGNCGLHWQLKRILSAPKHVEIGTIGTRRSTGINVKSPLHLRLAETLSAVGRSVLLVDTRRNGCGAQGSWTPLELATLIPEHFARLRKNPTDEYLYLHLPILAPSVGLLTQSRATKKQDGLTENDGWEVFRIAYLQEITDSQAIQIGRALVEHATVHSAMAVFLCAEPFEPDFNQSPREAQNANYCHRFTLVRAIADSIQADFTDAEIRRIDLSMGRSPHTTPMSRRR